MTAVQMLAAAVADKRGSRPLSQASLAHARHALVDTIGVTLAGASEPVSVIVRNHVQRLKSSGSSVVIGSELTCSSQDAALANAVTGHALDYDDSEFLLGGHPSITLLPAVLGLGQQIGCSGLDVIDAYMSGFDVITKLAKAVNFPHYEKGWHPTATLGTFGATAASARLLGLGEQQTGMALGLAASMASGLKQNFGTMAKPFQVGCASQNGVICATLAADGMTSSLGALEGEQGFFDVYNGPDLVKPFEQAFAPQDPETILAGLKFKKYSCCGSTHSIIDAAIALATEHDVLASDIVSINVAINRRRLPHVDRPVVADSLSAKFSLQYTVAVALSDRAVGLRHFTEAAIARQDIQGLMSRVRTAPLDPGADALSQACELSVVLGNGQTRSIRLEAAQGRAAADYPAYMRSKFLDCTWNSLEPPAANALFEALLGFDKEPNIDRVLSLLTRAKQGAPE